MVGKIGKVKESQKNLSEEEQKLKLKYDHYIISTINSFFYELPEEERQRLIKQEKDLLVKRFPDFRDKDWSRGLFQKWIILEVKRKLIKKMNLPTFEEWLESQGIKRRKKLPEKEEKTEDSEKAKEVIAKVSTKGSEIEDLEIIDNLIIEILKVYPDGLPLTKLAKLLGKTRQSLVRPIHRLQEKRVITKVDNKWKIIEQKNEG